MESNWRNEAVTYGLDTDAQPRAARLLVPVALRTHVLETLSLNENFCYLADLKYASPGDLFGSVLLVPRSPALEFPYGFEVEPDR